MSRHSLFNYDTSLREQIKHAQRMRRRSRLIVALAFLLAAGAGCLVMRFGH